MIKVSKMMSHCMGTAQSSLLLRFCTSVTLKSLEISAYSQHNQKVSTLHILRPQQVSDQLNISSACTVYISLPVSLFIVFLFFCYLACLASTQ